MYGDPTPIKNRLKPFLFTVFTKHQILLMREIGKNHTNITQILRKLAEEERIPEATLRFNAKKLKELGLIDFGDKLKKGINVEFTPLGLFFYEILKKDLEDNPLFIERKNK